MRRSVPPLTLQEAGLYTKSSIMLGLGETDDEVKDTMYDLKASVEGSVWAQANWASMGGF